MHIYATRDPALSLREKRHMALARVIAGQCAVLLENDGTLPLAGPGKIALYGNGARQTVRGGTGSGDVNVRSDVNIADGLTRAGFDVTTGPWLDRQDALHTKAIEDYHAWVPAYAREHHTSPLNVMFSNPFHIPAPCPVTAEDIAASGTDTALYVISRTSGEGADRFNKRGDYLLYGEEKEQLKTLGGAYEKLIVVLNIGGVMDLSELKALPGVNAVLLMGQLGNVGGDALADLLLGIVSPSGRLTDTWARAYADYPAAATFSHNDGDVDDEYYTEGVFVGYRWFDSFGKEPLYPFGYGLGYTTFSMTPGHACVEEGGIVTLPVTVRNTGYRPGQEVVQLYVSAPAGDVPKPRQTLAAFQKTKELAPGECEHVTLTFALADIASYHEKEAAWVLDKGSYILRVGHDSRDNAPAAEVILAETVVTARGKNLFPGAGQLRELTPPPAVREDIGSVNIVLNKETIPTRTFTYQGPRKPYTDPGQGKLTAADVKAGRCTVEELTAQLTVEEMAQLCVGTLRFESSIVGNASHAVPGAAGDTSSVIKESRGVKNLVMADGPAGLRLQPIFKTDKEGNILPGGGSMGGPPIPFDPKYDDTNSHTYYQYCTAIPIGWSLAMSWDPALLEQAGSMVGAEMEQFGVDLWLAPALNIHRDPLCGRNFEYYSEDPLIAGLAAAAITRGVQSHPGKGVTLKHFAANSQEDNRQFSNAHISERAIREIYLRGFEIAVRTAHPASIMTSYNLINGIHAANSYDLLQAVCRDEWGFTGVVMTDWFTSVEMPNMAGSHQRRYPISSSVGCAWAGNDIQMPGCQKNVDDIVRAVKTGEEVDGFRLTLADLQFCAANVIRAAIAADV